jgi:hypothetical protein
VGDVQDKFHSSKTVEVITTPPPPKKKGKRKRIWEATITVTEDTL